MNIENAKLHFESLIIQQLERIEKIKNQNDWIDFDEIRPINIGFIGGDGIGPAITNTAKKVLEELLSEQIKNKKCVFKDIEGLTIENRAHHNQAIPDSVLEDIKSCHVTLKGPTTTPEKGDSWPNIESANVSMRKELDLFANVRPVTVPEKEIDWVFFRENTEDLYAVGSQGIEIGSDLAIDFKVITSPGSKRIIEAAFEYAKKYGKSKVTVVTKANIIKTTDGKFLEEASKISKKYPTIECDSWYIDIMTAKLLDPYRRKDFQVLVMPNLYGDILTDQAAEIQGGVGTAGSANLGKRYSMFEAIHGSAPRMVQEGRAKYADPCSIIKAGSMMLQHIGFPELGDKLNKALIICSQFEKQLVLTGRDTGCTGEDFGKYVLETINDSKLEKKWNNYIGN